ncbi:glucans biosynthesis glucosyltransferase MdoH [Pseudoroseicyclus aestuarii]|uniref:Glucans biosynthesis glucosyltransferase H n=1 Tax=Pseudoroseicyclus aestuarii TaxID=1795041 RepID=A0A318SXK7_9RHOB|nr:glucans biosynthesis glucosyltransferase MdoH [Pseudoroseicyclus aestuarii]PYE86153.1 membrane glycosyltransferase [Pseudoroseicyclus aestuarii]
MDQGQAYRRPDRAREDHSAYLCRTVAIAGATVLAGFAAVMSLEGGQPWWIALLRALLLFATTFWLAWGAAQALLGLFAPRRPAPPRAADVSGATCAILVPIYNEDPPETFSRIAAMYQALQAHPEGRCFSFAILSDTRDAARGDEEERWFHYLLDQTGGAGRIFYRRRTSNAGRKAGNIQDFIETSGAAFDHVMILDADSIMAPGTMIEMLRRIEGDPQLGLLQSLPFTVFAHSRFARAMQFTTWMHSPAFARGLAVMQGRTGPFWGHNAIVRTRAFAECCGLPELPGRAPFGGHILSHDYVEAALLARGGWTVRLDEDLTGSFEEGPENVLDHAKRDRRWCQGNLQHVKLLGAQGLRPWSRYVFVQGILSYIAPLFWIGFLLASIAATATVRAPDYFPDENWPFPEFPATPASRTAEIAIGVIGLLVLPKLLVVLDACLRGRARGFGGSLSAVASTLSELLLSALLAPVLLMFQTRSVLQVLFGADGGWPASSRGDGTLDLRTAWQASNWITLWGVAVLCAAAFLAPGLVPWMLPVALPMIAAPMLIAWSSRRSASALFLVPPERDPDGVILARAGILADWLGEAPLHRGPDLPADRAPGMIPPAPHRHHA